MSLPTSVPCNAPGGIADTPQSGQAPAPVAAPSAPSTFQQDRYAGASGSTGIGNNFGWYVRVNIPVTTTITGVEYVVGGTQAGNVRAALYDSFGNRIAVRSAALAQGPINALQQVAFDTPITVPPGTYYIAISSDAGGATMTNQLSLVPSGGFAFATPPATIAPVSTAPAALGVPNMDTY